MKKIPRFLLTFLLFSNLLAFHHDVDSASARNIGTLYRFELPAGDGSALTPFLQKLKTSNAISNLNNTAYGIRIYSNLVDSSHRSYGNGSQMTGTRISITNSGRPYNYYSMRYHTYRSEPTYLYGSWSPDAS